MGFKNRFTFFYAITVICFLVLISFQNCSTNTDMVDLTGVSNQATCETKIMDSSQTPRTIFKVGDVINFYLNSSQPGYTGQFLIKNKYDNAIKNFSFVTPAYTQQIFANESDIGDYTYSTQIQDSTGKTVCQTGPYNKFKIISAIGTDPTCVLRVSSGDGQNFKVGEQVQLSVESIPSGLESFIAGQNFNSVGVITNTLPQVSFGLTPSSQVFTLTSSDVGQWKRSAEVRTTGGLSIACQPEQVVLNITVPPPPITPPPVTPPPVSPPPTSPRPTPSCGYPNTWGWVAGSLTTLCSGLNLPSAPCNGYNSGATASGCAGKMEWFDCGETMCSGIVYRNATFTCTCVPPDPGYNLP